ncbi:hypothetical protein Zmor_003904 [Zophobas morio]|uniref:Uncharacterized protein n=1 Tax=Zophobas morio TaxID=2755281 RepID=A0AA38M183_9CUCU|nr:hypothetical protein Zmor_003904 [Zophobas morio]
MSCRSCYNVKALEVCAINETHLLPNVALNLCNFITYRQVRIDARCGGVTVLVNRSIPHRLVSLPPPQRLKVVEISLHMAGQRPVSVDRCLSISLEATTALRFRMPSMWGNSQLFCVGISIASTLHGTA